MSRRIIIHKGGPGSGNFGHLGRPGKVGGSQSYTGGLARYGLTNSSSLDERRQRQAEHRATRAKFMADTKRIAARFGFPAHRLVYGGAGYNFDVGGSGFRAAAHYDPRDGRITFFDGALTVDKYINGEIAAHEIQHAIYHDYSKRRKQDTEDIFRESMAQSDWRLGPVKASGELRTSELATKYPAYDTNQWLSKRVTENDPETNQEYMARKDGVTPYSRSYWDAYNNDPTKPAIKLDNAMDETMAEIARLDARSSYDAAYRDLSQHVDPIWLQYYRAVRSAAYAK